MSSQQVVIREEQLHDREAVLALWEQLVAHHKPHHDRLYEVRTDAPLTYDRWLARRIKEDGAQVLVAEVMGSCVGYILTMLGQRAPTFKLRNVGMICDLVVARDRRRQGIGEALVSQAMFNLLQQGISTIQVDYDHANPQAVSFWTKLGFKPRLIEAYRHLSASDVEEAVGSDDIGEVG